MAQTQPAREGNRNFGDGSKNNRKKEGRNARPSMNNRRRKLRKERSERQKRYDKMVEKSGDVPSLWSFESLFPEPIIDEKQVKGDLEEVSLYKKDEKKRILDELAREQKIRETEVRKVVEELRMQEEGRQKILLQRNRTDVVEEATNQGSNETFKVKVDWKLSRKVEDSIYGIRRDPISGQAFDDTSLSGGEGAIKFRNGVRLGKALKVNVDRLTYFARKEMQRNHLSEAQDLYELAISTDPFDGRAYLGLSRIAQRKREFVSAKKYLKRGISRAPNNPFLLQALGTLEERVGNLAEAEAYYIASLRARSSHAAAWVSLAQLRVRKLRQPPDAGRICFQTAERELRHAGMEPSSYVYTAWASLEYKEAGNYNLAKSLFKKALEVDPKCSAAWLQLGVMEADKENWKEARNCFETVLKFDKRNSRVLQAYALAESKRPDGKSREVIDLFERALAAKPSDAGVYQAYGLYVNELGDVEMARELLQRGSVVGKKHAPLWQAWGVLETNFGEPDVARGIFQQGIWSCAQSGGSQSGGKRCARLWQAWGVLEAREGEYAAARRCFSRTLDAENNNVAAVTAWALMEESIGNNADARSIFERALKLLPHSSPDKVTLWRAYELLELDAGNLEAADIIHNRGLKEAKTLQDSFARGVSDIEDDLERESSMVDSDVSVDDVLNNDQVELIARWKGKGNVGYFDFEDEEDVWLNNGSIEGRVPMHKMNKHGKNKDKNKKSSNLIS